MDSTITSKFAAPNSRRSGILQAGMLETHERKALDVGGSVAHDVQVVILCPRLPPHPICVVACGKGIETK